MRSAFKAVEKVKYLLSARHRKGFGVHSPSVFRLLNRVVYEKDPYYSYHSARLNDSEFGSHNQCLPLKYRQLIFRLANSNNTKQALLLGESASKLSHYVLPVSSQTLIGATNEHLPLEYCNSNAESDKRVSILPQIEQIDKIFAKSSVDFIVFDVEYFENDTIFAACYEMLNKDSVAVLLNIRRDKNAAKSWKHICRKAEVVLSLDFFEMGVLLFDNEIPKQHYTIAF